MSCFMLPLQVICHSHQPYNAMKHLPLFRLLFCSLSISLRLPFVFRLLCCFLLHYRFMAHAGHPSSQASFSLNGLKPRLTCKACLRPSECGTHGTCGSLPLNSICFSHCRASNSALLPPCAVKRCRRYPITRCCITAALRCGKVTRQRSVPWRGRQLSRGRKW